MIPEEFQRKLQRFANEMPGACERGLSYGADLMVRETQMKHLRGPTSSGGGWASESLSRRSGRFFGSITKKVSVSGGQITATVGTNVKSKGGFPYPVVHEYGGRFHPQRPSVRPSVEAKQPAMMKAVLAEIMKAYGGSGGAAATAGG